MKKQLCRFTFFLAIALLVACSSEASSEKDIDVIKLTDPSNDVNTFQNYIAQTIIEEGYSVDTDAVTGSSMALFQGLQEGNIHVNIEVWTENQKDVWEEAIESGDVINMGTNYYDEGQGFYVPTYVIEGDPERNIEPMAPNLKTVEDLKDYPDLFEDPEDPGRGRIINSPSGWSMQEVMSEKIKTYGLDETMNDFIPGSDAALVASLVDAHEKGEPWVGYYWSPTWVTAKYDLTLLEEPEYDEDIWDKNKGTAYPINDVTVAVYKELPEQYPEIAEFLENYEMGVERIEETTLYMEENDITAEETSKWWLEENEDVWTEWIPDDITEKVKEAL